MMIDWVVLNFQFPLLFDWSISQVLRCGWVILSEVLGIAGAVHCTDQMLFLSPNQQRQSTEGCYVPKLLSVSGRTRSQTHNLSMASLMPPRIAANAISNGSVA